MAATKDHMRNRILVAEQKFATNNPDLMLSTLALESQANRVISRAAFKKMIQPRTCAHVGLSSGRVCVPRVEVKGAEYWTIKLSGKPTMLEVFHSMAHAIQNVTVTGLSGWPSGQIHDVEFVKLYLDLVRRFYNNRSDPAMMKTVKGYLLDEKVKTSTKSPEAREKARAAWHKRRLPTVREQLLKMREELQDEV